MKQAQVDFKLDFNERSDNLPQWLNQIKISTGNLWRYPDRKTLEQQLEADMGLPTGTILLTNGGDEGIDLLFKRSKINNETLCIPEPCFSQYTHNTAVWQNDCQFIPANPSQPLAIEVASLKQAAKAGQWLVITRPNNPTGEFITKQSLLDLIEKAKNQNAKVFVDEAYIEFALAEQSGECIDISEYVQFDHVVVLRTFSKAFGIAGARVGYLVGSPQLINDFRRLAPPFNVSVISLQLATAAWQNRSEIDTYVAHIAKNRQKLTQFLQQYRLQPFPSQGNFVLFNTPKLQKELLFRVLKRQGIVIKTELNGLPEAVRITVPYNLQPLINALQQILNPALLAFDMDGVLIDTSASYDECIKQTVKRLSNKSVKQADIDALRSAGGYNNDWYLSYKLLQQNDFNGSYDEAVKVFQSLYFGTEKQDGLINAEKVIINASLRLKLKSDDKRKTAVVTGRPRPEATLGLQKIDFQPDILISADDVQQQKPNPEGLHKVQSTFNLVTSPEYTINNGWFFGDTVDDMQAGRAAGCVCIGVGGAHLTAAGADLIIDDINQIETLL